MGLQDAADWYAWYKREGGAQLRAIAWSEWDPIGLREMVEWPDDEYDAYLGPIASTLRRGASAEDLAAQLADYRVDRMGLQPNPDVDLRAAQQMVTWYASAPRGPDPDPSR